MKKFFLLTFLVTLFVPALFAQTRTPVVLPDTVKDAWGKPGRYTVTQPNIIQVRGTVTDMGCVIFRDLKYDGQKKLVVKVRSLEGRFRWDKGKMFGFSIGTNANDKSTNLVPQEPRKLLDKMVDGPFVPGDEVVFVLPDTVAGKPGPLTLSMTTYIGGTFEVEIWFE